MKLLGRWFLQGLVALLPIALTLAILYWLATTAESTLGAALQVALPDGWYFPGLGILAAFVVITLVGLLVNAYLFRLLLGGINKVLERIPLVRTLFDSIRDIARFAQPEKRQEGIQRVVKVTLDDGLSVYGFVTSETVPGDSSGNLKSVYLPMSYQIGGFTVAVDEKRLEDAGMDVQSAMRFVLTAGMVGQGKDSTK